MYDRIPRNVVTSTILAWTTHSANVEPVPEEEDARCDVDKPPEHPPMSPITSHFHRTPIRHEFDPHQSLLTKALNVQDEGSAARTSISGVRRRRSVTSNTSLASTTELTCETGITTPARTSSPSPELLHGDFVPLASKAAQTNSALVVSPPKPTRSISAAEVAKAPTLQAPPKKRCISFACAAKPRTEEAAAKTTQVKLATAQPPKEEVPKKISIKFACPTRPTKETSEQNSSLARTPVAKKSTMIQKETSPKHRSSSTHRSPSTVRSVRSSTPRRYGHSPVATRSKKYLDANTKELQGEGFRFHEFASDEPQEDDWIRRDEALARRKLTIRDTLEKENAIRKLGKEAEEEADLELEQELDEEEDSSPEDDEDQDEDQDEDGDYEDIDEADDDVSDYGSDDGSDGYNTDNEVGFADSDDEDDDLVLWTTSKVGQLTLSGATPIARTGSLSGHSSDASDSGERPARSRPKKTKSIVFRPGTPELPDSTDFVCGTLDEDRPLEDAYISCIALRRREKLIPIPQDIDPSFPNSEPEDEAEEFFKQAQGDSDDQVWVHGELEDIHHELDRMGRTKKNGKDSPKRLRSPPPKRTHSPAPKLRGRSPRRPSGLTSPKRLRSPAPRHMGKSPALSPSGKGRTIAFKEMGPGQGVTSTKSLPRAPAVFMHGKGRKRASASAKTSNSTHVRGAIDIVKGLEQKRQRRKEKFYQKYCNNRARKEKAHERLPPGQGAERMKAIGLGQAKAQGNYVLSC